MAEEIADNRARAARAAGAVPARRVARAADAGDDRARPSRAARRASDRTRRARGRARRARRGSSGSSTGCCCSRRRSGPTSSAATRSTSRRFSRTSSCAGRTSRRAPGGSGRRARRSLRADEEALRTALDALLENAVKYTEPDDDDRAARAAGGPRARDRGRRRRAAASPPRRSSGSSTASRAPTTRATAPLGGVGLGLAIVDAIARAHGGSCTVESLAGGVDVRAAAARGSRWSGVARRLVAGAASLAPRVERLGGSRQFVVQVERRRLREDDARLPRAVADRRLAVRALDGTSSRDERPTSAATSARSGPIARVVEDALAVPRPARPARA